MRVVRVIGGAVLLLAIAPVAGDAAPLQPGVGVDPPTLTDAESPHAAMIAEAAKRFDLPARWIDLVLRAESGGDPGAVSTKGAMGLMQLMPATWEDLRLRYDLGGDPFDPRANILGGAAYLREMLDRFGAPGFLAAYNAGPGRYAEHLATGDPLPAETRAYLARLAPQLSLDGGPSGTAAQAATPAQDWRDAPMFVARSGTPGLAPGDAVGPGEALTIGTPVRPGLDTVPRSGAENPFLAPRSGLFVPLDPRHEESR